MLTENNRPLTSIQWLCIDCPKDRYRIGGPRKKLPFASQHCPHSLHANHVINFKGESTCRVTSDDIRVAKPFFPVTFPPNNYHQSKILAYSNHWQAPFLANKGVRIQNRLNLDQTNALKYFTGFRNISLDKNDWRNFVLHANDSCDGWQDELKKLIEHSMAPIINDQKIMSVLFKKRTREERPKTCSERSRLYSSDSGRLIRNSTGYRPCSSSSRSRNLESSRGQLHSSSSIKSRLGSAKSVIVDHNEDAESQKNFQRQIFYILGGILQTQDPEVIKTWLTTATEREKALICDIVRSALTDQEEMSHFVKESEKETFNRTVLTPPKFAGPQDLDTIQENKMLSSEVNTLIVHDEPLKPINTDNLLESKKLLKNVFNKKESETQTTSRPKNDSETWIPNESIA